ncbi:MAG: GntR family transcriptional regulator [Mycobacterium sp.]|nr:GntR family transcriptional regulator [Mycobacterium sp.]
MELQPITRTAVSDTIYGQLVNEILTGRLPAGQAMPSERELALAFQVNRHAIREALKRVQQAGLIKISRGGKTRVLDWRSSAGLEALSALVGAGVVPADAILSDVAVMRRTIGADAARTCAQNASDQQLTAVSDAARDYPEAGGEGADLEFWTTVVDGSGNLAYRLALNTLVAAINDIGATMIAELGSAELGDRDAHVELARVIAARDAEEAHRLAHQMLSHIVVALTPEGK